MNLMPDILKKASDEEMCQVPFSHPGVQALHKQLSAVRARVPGMDESQKNLQSKIWSTNLAFNPPSLLITINPSDTHDLIMQVLAGANIDLNHFLNSVGPLAKDQG